MRKSWVTALALAAGLAGLLASGPVPAQERVDIDAKDPPFSYADANGAAAGVYADLVRAAFALMKEPLVIEAVPWKRALAEIDAGTAGAGGMYKTRERALKYDFSEAMFTEKLVVYVRRDRTFRFAGVDDLAGLRVGVLRGWSHGDAFDVARMAGRLQVEEVVTDAQNFSKLDAGRLDAVVAIEQSGKKLLAGGFPSLQALPVPLAMITAHLAFNRAQHKRPLLVRFDAALGTLRRSGEYDRIVERAMAPR